MICPAALFLKDVLRINACKNQKIQIEYKLRMVLFMQEFYVGQWFDYEHPATKEKGRCILVVNFLKKYPILLLVPFR